MYKTISRLDQLINDQSIKYPDKIAIKHGSKAFTYKSVDEISTQLSLFFNENKINQGDIIGVALDRSPELVIVLLAIIKAGATYLPIDGNFPADRINYMLKDAEAKLLVTSKSFRDKHQQVTDMIFIEDAWEQYTKYDTFFREPVAVADSLAYILYTSGSTGHPKGVQVKHAGLLNLLLSVQQEPGMNHNDIILATTTISFDIAELEVFLPLISGAQLVIADADAVKDGRMLLELARSEKITIMQGTPFMWRTMLEAGWDNPLPVKVFCGGEAMAMDLAKSLLERCLGLWNMYGPTETTIYSIIKKVTPEDEVITIGKPIRNTQVYLLDEQLNEVPQGEVGEICIGGTGVARGYINKPELTAEKFIDDTFSAAAGQKMYKTGDLGKLLDNGEIHCLGRIDHQIKIRGYRIETEEIEYQLKQQDNVKNALVTIFKDILENVHLVAYIVPESKIEDAELSDKLKTWKNGLKVMVPEYMIPDSYMVIPSIPLMPNGKVDRQSLPDPVARENSLSKFESPQTETERLLSEIWLKNIALNKISITDNFFELGMDSLVAVKIMIRIEKQFGKRMPLSVLIQYPTIRQLARHLDNDTPGSAYKSLVPIKPGGSKIPLYIVHGIGLNVLNLYNMVAQLDPDQPVYGLQAVGLDGTLAPLDDMEAIAKFYVGEIIEHNPSGPYAISGYSFGGYIAYEMARQLKEMGKELKLLGMFDTNIQYPTHQYPLAKKIRVKLLRQAHKLLFRTGTVITRPALTAAYLKAYYSQKLKLQAAHSGMLEDYNTESLPGFMQEIVNGLQTAFNSYIVKPSPVRIDLFKAETRLYFVDDSSTLGWGRYALKGVAVHVVPGDHKDMFSAPNDKILARVLQDTLDKN